MDSNFEGFLSAIGDEAGLVLKDRQSELSKVMEYRLGEALDAVGDLPEPSAPEFAPREVAVRRLFLGAEELEASLQALRNISVYVRRFPYSRDGINKVAYLRYHVENYLNELYILAKRLESYLTMAARIYKKDRRSGEIRRASSVVSRHFASVLSGLIEVRGAHVHVHRYDDVDLTQLTTLGLVGKNDSTLAALYERRYREVRTKKRRWIDDTNASVERLLDAYFGILAPLLFDAHGRLRTPGAA